jgi:hypothetical protein
MLATAGFSSPAASSTGARRLCDSVLARISGTGWRRLEVASRQKSDGFLWHSYGTPAASKPHAMARVTSGKWLSEQVASGVEQRIIDTFNPLVDGSIPSRPIY